MLYSPVHKAITSLVCVVFAIGIILQHNYHFSEIIIRYIIVLASIILSFLQFRPTLKYSSCNCTHLLLVVILSLSLGAYRLHLKHQPPSFDQIQTTAYVATVQKVPNERENSFRIDLIIDSVSVRETLQPSKIHILAYFEKTSDAAGLLPGDVLYIQGQLEAVSGAFNPEGFDYSQYLSHHNIFATSYVPQDQWARSNHTHHTLVTRAAKVQHLIVSRLSQLPFGPQELGVLSALTVGYKAMIDEDQKQAYSASGATHVLAVSGLHVGILFIFLSRLLSLFGKWKGGLWFRTLLTIILLWCFAFISGLSPSVCRATLMFSFINIGIAQKRRSNIFNMVFISALVLLILNPLNIFSLGFQLSYAAVLGILTFEPLFEELLYERWHIYKPLSELMAVSVAAQLGTVPIVIHTFNTFPLYFLLTNIWIIPLVTIILNGAIVLIIFCLANIPCLLFAKLLNLLLMAMNRGVSLISELPYSQFQNLYLSNVQTILAYTLLFLLGIAIIHHNKQLLTLSLFCLMTICSVFFLNTINQKDEHYLFSFYNRNEFNLCMQQGNRAQVFTEIPQTLPDYFIHHRLKGACLQHCKGEDVQTSNMLKIQDFMIVGDRILGFYKPNMEEIKSSININTLIINQDYPKDLYKLYRTIHFDEMILYERPRNYYYYHNFCERNKIKLHTIARDGAYIASLDSDAASSRAASN